MSTSCTLFGAYLPLMAKVGAAVPILPMSHCIDRCNDYMKLTGNILYLKLRKWGEVHTHTWHDTSFLVVVVCCL